MKTWIIVDVFDEIVAKVSDTLTAQLQAIDTNITGVHYEHGHIREIVHTLTHKDQVMETRMSRYPLVALIQDFPERVSDQPGIQSDVTLNLILAKMTDQNYRASERYEFNFKPFLYPLYSELMHEIWRHPSIMAKSADQIQHTKIDRVFWGREGVYGSEANIFNDWIDCIEIRDLRLKINAKLC